MVRVWGGLRVGASGSPAAASLAGMLLRTGSWPHRASRAQFASMPAAAQVAASAAIPLRGLLSQRRLSGAWRLKEATAGVVEADRLDLGRATVQLAWWVQPCPPWQGPFSLLVCTVGSCVPCLACICTPPHMPASRSLRCTGSRCSSRRSSNGCRGRERRRRGARCRQAHPPPEALAPCRLAALSFCAFMCCRFPLFLFSPLI